MRLKVLADQEGLSAAEILEVVDLVGERGDVILLKHDGLRERDRYTVVLIPAKAEVGIRMDVEARFGVLFGWGDCFL